MKPVLTAAETAAIDRESEARGVPVIDLMERAGWAVARAAVELAGGAYGRRAVVVAHKGNNGGDGFVAARHLARWGMGVTTILLADPGEIREPAASNLRRLAGSRILPADPSVLDRELARADVAIDAIFGTGFRGVPEGPAASAIDAINASGVPVVAVDIPSGVNGDTGTVPGEAVRADVTVALGAPKAGDVLFPGAAHAGELRVADIGFPPDLVHSDLWLVEEADAASLLPVRPSDAHKRSTGVVLIVAGSRGMPGAASLVASGAIRGGAGLVRMAVVPGVIPAVAAHHPEVTFLALPESAGGTLGAGSWDAIRPELDRVHAVAIGPGLTTDEEAAAEVRRIVVGSPVPVVADADALNAFAGRTSDLADREGDLILTPHGGEFGRLAGLSSSEVLEDRVGHVRKASSAWGCTVLLKGPRTLVASPEGEVRVNPTGSPALATGGTGDVLTGLIGTLLGRGLPSEDAGTLAAFVHGRAGEIAGRELGDATSAPDVAARIPNAVRTLRARA